MDRRIFAPSSYIDRPVAHQRALHRADPRTAHYAEAALAKQVVGVAVSPLVAAQGAPIGGWLPVGAVLDEIAGEELRVRLSPATRRVKTGQMTPSAPNVPPRPQPSAPCFNGERMRRVEPEEDGSR